MISLEQQFALSLNILLAGLLSALIGIDREQRARNDAGLRTHMLVGMGSCLFTLLSIHAFGGNGDPARVAAQIVSGIGFLGAGVIIFRGRRVHNLTTAASVWVTAAIGMTVGTGAWLLGIVATLIVWFTLDPLRKMTKARRESLKVVEEALANDNSDAEA